LKKSVIEMKVADRITLELPLGWFVTLGLRQAVDAMPLQEAVQRRTREMWNSGLEGIEAIIERQERVLAKGDDQRFFLFAEYR
jgi:hypothetical protein